MKCIASCAPPQVAQQYLQFLLQQRKFAEAAELCPELLTVRTHTNAAQCSGLSTPGYLGVAWHSVHATDSWATWSVSQACNFAPNSITWQKSACHPLAPVQDDAAAWERQIYTFAQHRQLPLLAPHIPIGIMAPTLRRQAYEMASVGTPFSTFSELFRVTGVLAISSPAAWALVLVASPVRAPLMPRSILLHPTCALPVIRASALYKELCPLLILLVLKLQWCALQMSHLHGTAGADGVPAVTRTPRAAAAAAQALAAAAVLHRSAHRSHPAPVLHSAFVCSCLNVEGCTRHCLEAAFTSLFC